MAPSSRSLPPPLRPCLLRVFIASLILQDPYLTALGHQVSIMQPPSKPLHSPAIVAFLFALQGFRTNLQPRTQVIPGLRATVIRLYHLS